MPHDAPQVAEVESAADDPADEPPSRPKEYVRVHYEYGDDEKGVLMWESVDEIHIGSNWLTVRWGGDRTARVAMDRVIAFQEREQVN